MSQSFWKNVDQLLKVCAPLVKVLQLVDGDRKPSMGFLYGEIIQEKEAIKSVLNRNEANYKTIIEIVNSRMKGRLDSALHVTSYLLKPYYYYTFSTIFLDNVIAIGVFDCVEAFFPNDLAL